MVNSAWSKDPNSNFQDAEKVKEWMVSYYALCEEVDYYVGLLLDKLDELGIADNTFVIFETDHGEALGAHGMKEKNTFLEESARVPLLIRFPGRIEAGTEVDIPVSTLDCFATILDYLGASEYDDSDGKSLRRFIENSNYNESIDDEAIITEWDFRLPLEQGGLARPLGSESNFLIRKGRYKLMLTKLASSSRLDMMYDIDADPYEMSNLVGNNGMSASDAVIGKAEHLKCLLIEWMQRMDGGTNHYYSNPFWNNGEGMGDIAEITARRKWKTLDIWVSDPAVKVGLPVDVDGQLTRNEYIYLGRTTAGTLTISNITVEGADAGRIELSEFTSGSITQGNYARVKITYRPTYYGEPITDTKIVISHSVGEDNVIELSAMTPSNSCPKITSPPGITVDVGNAYSYTLTATDSETNALSYSSVTLPAWLNFNTNTAVLSGTPSRDDIGSHPVTLRVSDLYGRADQSFTVWVGTAGNDSPVITSSPETGVFENQAYSYIASAVDVDGDDLTFAAPTKSAWLSFNSTNRVLSGTPSSLDVGMHPVVLSVSDATVSVEQRFNIVVFAVPIPENLLQNGSFETGSTADWTLFSPSEVTVSTNTASDGIYALKYSTTDGTISPTRQLIPVQTNTDYILTYGVNYTSETVGIVVVRINVDGIKYKSPTKSPTEGWQTNQLLFSSGSSTQVTLDVYADNFSGTVYVDDLLLPEPGGENMAPVITSIPITNVTQTAAYSYRLLAADADGDSLTFSQVTLPPWLRFDAGSGVLSGTSTNASNYAVELSVTDGQTVMNQSFMITVLAVTGYDEWAAVNGVTGGLAGDDDGDGMKNLFEYAVSKNPMLVNSGGLLDYVYLQRNDDTNLIYRIEATTNLVLGAWTSGVYTVLRTNVLGGAYDEVTCGIPVTNTSSYIRLQIKTR